MGVIGILCLITSAVWGLAKFLCKNQPTYEEIQTKIAQSRGVK